MLRPVNRYKCQGFSLRSKNLRKYIIKDKIGDKSATRKRAIYTCHKGENFITCNCSALPVTVVPLNESESAFLQDEHFQNPLILQEVGVPSYVL